MTTDEWAALASERCAPEVVKHPELFAAGPLAVQKPRSSVPAPRHVETDETDEDTDRLGWSAIRHSRFDDEDRF